jgi:hypothetical protein
MLEMSWPDNYTREPIVSPSEAVVLPTFGRALAAADDDDPAGKTEYAWIAEAGARNGVFCLASDCKRFAVDFGVLRLDWERYSGASGCSICRQGEFDDPRAVAVIGSGWLVRWSVQCGAN